MMIDAYTKEGALSSFDAPLSVEIADDLYAAGPCAARCRWRRFRLILQGCG